MLSGKKTYLIGALMVLYGVGMFFLGEISQSEAATLAMEGLGFIAVRLGIKKGAD